MRIFIIGASGFLGSNIAQQLMKQSIEVWGTYYRNNTNVPPRCKSVSIDDIESLEDNFDVIFLVAGNYGLTPKELIDINVHLVKRVSDHFQTARIIFISSVAVYGSHKNIVHEQSSFNNPSFYGLAKLAGEAVTQTHQNYAILRLTYLYGGGMPTNSFLPTIIQKAKTDKKIVLFGKGERLQDYLHIKDAVNFCIKASENKENGIYLGATGQSLSNLQVAKIIKQYLPECQIKFAGTDTAPWFRINPASSEKKLNWCATHKLISALKEMI